GPVALTGRGSFTLADARTAVTLAELSGMVQDRPLRLTAPAILALAGETTTLDRLALSYGYGSLAARYAAAPDRLALDFEAEDIDLGLLPLALNLPPFAGTASGAVHVEVADGRADGTLALDATVRPESGTEDAVAITF